MAQHFLLTPAARDVSVADIATLTDAEVLSLFARLRWGDEEKQACPKCGVVHAHYFIRVRGQWRCRDCQHTFSATSGTFLADHKLPLRTLLMALLLYVNAVKGLSASQFSRALGIAYMTGFTLLHKFREALYHARDTSPLKGLVQVDGSHFAGRKRKPRVLKKAKPKTLPVKGPRAHPSTFHPNRRIVMVLRELGTEPKQGAVRTVVSVVVNEGTTEAMELAQRYIEEGATVMTDECNAYSSYPTLYDHKTVNHSTEFSTDEGVNNNQAESFFTRGKRFVVGQIHRLTPKYLMDYMVEMAWREDQRRKSPSEQIASLIKSLCRPGGSKWWCGYWQGNKRTTELLLA